MSVNIIWLEPTATDISGTQITEINFGDIVRPGSATESFKIGNTGASTAEQVVLTADGADTEAVGWKSFSSDDATYDTSLSLADIAQDGITPVTYVKTDIPADGTTGSHSTSLKISYVFV